MRKIVFYTGLVVTLFATACTKDFEEINTDPKRYSPENFDANYFLASSQNTYAGTISGYAGPMLFQSGWMQIFSMATVTGDYYTNADKYVASSNTNSYIQSSWNNGYRAASLANEIIINRGGDPEWANVTAIATIMKVLSMQYITDAYGDAPYSEALQARSGITLPKYDRQEDIYNAMLRDLENALVSMDAGKAKPTADISSLNGDVAKWKRFGYSLMLRLAMRLVKQNLSLAQTWALKAYAGGTLAKGEDVYFKQDNANGYGNPNINAWLVATDFYQVRWSKTMIDYLKAANDPRLGIVAEVPQAGYANNNIQALAGDKTPAAQMGMPNGYDLNAGSQTNIDRSPGYPGGTGTGTDVTPIGRYSRPAIGVYASRDIPVFVLSYAESELLLAEAAVRGWSVGASAAAHYQNAVSGGIQALNAFKSGVADAGAADAYAASRPLDVSSTAKSLEMINTQYWATTGMLLNFAEAWNNWKRSGYPNLTPVNYPGNFSGGTIPRRQPYPTGEATSNPANYAEALSRLSNNDNFNARVWWDK
ncbi:SusD/RagB family nutrient-binding outer membrane lipoprotein [Flavisolibacter sp. BT320]|nr:SusD/RagB family nutrient-binding outer membrane lipoprotein [Flavisolibacter longurius]